MQNRLPLGPRTPTLHATRNVLLTVLLAAFHLFGFDLRCGALSTEEPRLRLALAHLILALHVYVGLAHAALDSLARVTCGEGGIEMWR